jgi:transposase
MEREDQETGRTQLRRIHHEPGAIRQALNQCAPGTDVAVEAIGSWYWIVDEIEAAGLVPRLVHPRKAKVMMAMTNKTDKLDVHGLNRLQRNGTLPTVWIAPGPVRDLRELTRTRILLTRQRTRLKNRLRATLAKYNLAVLACQEAFGPRARKELRERIAQTPAETAWVSGLLLDELDVVQSHIAAIESRFKKLIILTPPMQQLLTLPGVGVILSATLALEIGDVSRFRRAESLAVYAGTTPRVHGSGDKTRYGPLRTDVNQTLKWAFAEAANSVAAHSRRRPQGHVSHLYVRLRARKGHAKAIGAVARHLAEAAWHVLSRKEPYLDPTFKRSREAEA